MVEEKFVCPICANIMVIYMDTPVCTICNRDAVMDLTWCKKFLEEKKI